jgi:hypothetical protein
VEKRGESKSIEPNRVAEGCRIDTGAAILSLDLGLGWVGSLRVAGGQGGAAPVAEQPYPARLAHRLAELDEPDHLSQRAPIGPEMVDDQGLAVEPPDVWDTELGVNRQPVQGTVEDVDLDGQVRGWINLQIDLLALGVTSD